MLAVGVGRRVGLADTVRIGVTLGIRVRVRVRLRVRVRVRVRIRVRVRVLVRVQHEITYIPVMPCCIPRMSEESFGETPMASMSIG